MNCKSYFTKKSGFRNGKQKYKYNTCDKQFLGGNRIDIDLLWEEYLRGKQTYLQLSKKYKCSKRTIQIKIDLYKLTIKVKSPRKVIVLMDTTYWGRSFGVMLFKDAITKENLLKYFVKNETNFLYKKGIRELEEKGYTIAAIVSDGRKGLAQSFRKIPVQMCQFHQVVIIRRYITKNPKLPASIDLKDLVAMMKMTDKEFFEGALDDWYIKWENFLNERTLNIETGRSYYTHKRLRNAYRSLKSNLPWLFVWYEYIELNIPNTTNAIDGHFGSH